MNQNGIDDYISLILSLPQLQPATVMSIFFLTLARLLPIVSIAPFLGSRNVPRVIRMMFSVALVAIFLPQNLVMTHSELPYNMTFIGYMAKELMIGFMLGFLAAVPFYIAQMSGSLIDHQRGAASLQVTDPTTQSQTGPVGILYNYVLIALFFSLSGPFFFMEGIASSYKLIPVDGLINPAFFTQDITFWNQIFGLFQLMMSLSIQLAAPALIGILLTDMFLGIANRLAPQVQIVFLGISLKSWVGIAMLAAAWVLILKVLGKESIQWMHNLKEMIEQIGKTYGPSAGS